MRPGPVNAMATATSICSIYVGTPSSDNAAPSGSLLAGDHDRSFHSRGRRIHRSINARSRRVRQVRSPDRHGVAECRHAVIALTSRAAWTNKRGRMRRHDVEQGTESSSSNIKVSINARTGIAYDLTHWMVSGYNETI